jgi:hypothetical protein
VTGILAVALVAAAIVITIQGVHIRQLNGPSTGRHAETKAHTGLMLHNGFYEGDNTGLATLQPNADADVIHNRAGRPFPIARKGEPT